MRLRRWLKARWVVAALCLTLLFGLVYGLQDGEWLNAPDVLWIAAGLAIPMGLLLGRLAPRPGDAAAVAIATGLLFSVAYHSQALPAPEPALNELAAQGQWIGAEASRLLSQAADPEGATAPLPQPAMQEWQASGERLSLYGWNIQSEWPPSITGGQLKIGQILVGSLLALFVWAITAATIWAVARRRSIWGAFAPAAALLAASIYFTGQGWPYLVISTSASLLLICDLSQKRLLSQWQEDTLPYDLVQDRWVSASTIVGAVGLTMMFMVQITDPETRRWIDDTFFPQQPAPVAAASQGGSAQPRSSAAALGTLPTQHLLGSGPELSQQTVMQVHTPGITQARFYWRAAVYDKYTGHGWIQSALDDESDGAEPLWPQSAEPPEHFAVLRQTYRLESHTGQVYAAGRPVRLSQPARGVWLAPLGQDLLAVNTLAMQSGYEVLSWVPVATADELRGASTEVPEWVSKAYLALPDDLPDRVTALALKTTSGADTPYDKAVAIQTYLRDYPYTLDLDAPPPDRDVTDYFLFDLRRGYCDYYATAMVVMARSAGVPARLAIGYATGEYDPKTATYRVSLADAHAWPELYFPDYGWIAFEPTAGFEEPSRGLSIDWVSQAEAAREENIETFPESSAESAATGLTWVQIALIAGPAVIFAGVGISMVYRRRKRRAGTPRQIISGLYRDLVAGGRRLGVPVSAAQTPDEFLRSFLSEVAARTRRAPDWGGDWEARGAQVSQAASALVLLYTQLVYSPSPPAKSFAEVTLDAWPRLNRDLWTFWLAGMIPRL